MTPMKVNHYKNKNVQEMEVSYVYMYKKSTTFFKRTCAIITRLLVNIPYAYYFGMGER